MVVGTNYTFFPNCSNSVFDRILSRFPASPRLIFSNDFSRHAAISSLTVSTNVSIKKLYISAGELALEIKVVKIEYVRFGSPMSIFYLCYEDFIVSAFHYILLQCKRITYEDILLNNFSWE